MPVTVSNLRSVVAQVTRGGGRWVIVARRNLSGTSRRRNLSSTSRRRKSYDSGSIVESGVSYYNASLPSFSAGVTSFVAWQMIQMREYLRTVQRDVEELNGLESKTPQRNVLREAWQLLYG